MDIHPDFYLYNINYHLDLSVITDILVILFGKSMTIELMVIDDSILIIFHHKHDYVVLMLNGTD